MRFPAPRSDEAVELSRLIDERLALDARIDSIDEAERTAWQNVHRRSAELAELERSAAGGGKVSDSERTKLEQELAEARARAQEPWAERRAGVENAARDADQQLGRFIGENLDALLAELHEDAEASAAAVDAAAHQLVSSYHERMLVEARVTALCALVRPARPGDISRTRAEAVVREAERLLAQGEQPPTLQVDPRKPRHGATIADESEREPLVSALQ